MTFSTEAIEIKGILLHVVRPQVSSYPIVHRYLPYRVPQSVRVIIARLHVQLPEYPIFKSRWNHRCIVKSCDLLWS